MSNKNVKTVEKKISLKMLKSPWKVIENGEKSLKNVRILPWEFCMDSTQIKLSIYIIIISNMLQECNSRYGIYIYNKKYVQCIPFNCIHVICIFLLIA